MTSVADEGNKHRNLSTDFPFVGRKIYIKSIQASDTSHQHDKQDYPKRQRFALLPRSDRMTGLGWTWSDVRMIGMLE
jgi:hypothetical protein